MAAITTVGIDAGGARKGLLTVTGSPQLLTRSMIKKKLASALLIAPVVLAGLGAAVLSVTGDAQAQQCTGGLCYERHNGTTYY